MLPLVFSSSLNSDQRDELESLMFFHPEQGQHTSSINASILSYGFPKVIDEGGALRIGIEGLEVQTLYAFVDRGAKKDLAGVLVYTRIHDDTSGSFAHGCSPRILLLDWLQKRTGARANSRATAGDCEANQRNQKAFDFIRG